MAGFLDQIEPVTAERYCRCRVWKRYTHVPSEHAKFVRMRLGRKGSRLAQLTERIKAEASP